MGKLHRLLNYPKKVHKYTNPRKQSGATIYDCEYCYDLFFTGSRERIPFGVGAKYPDENCNRGKVLAPKG